MIVFHVTKNKKIAQKIAKEMVLKTNKHDLHDRPYVFLFLNAPKSASYALDVIGEDTNEAWIFKLDIPGDIELIDDPMGEDEIYGNVWKASESDVPINKILEIKHIKNVRDWPESDDYEENVTIESIIQG